MRTGAVAAFGHRDRGPMSPGDRPRAAAAVFELVFGKIAAVREFEAGAARHLAQRRSLHRPDGDSLRVDASRGGNVSPDESLSVRTLPGLRPPR